MPSNIFRSTIQITEKAYRQLSTSQFNLSYEKGLHSNCTYVVFYCKAQYIIAKPNLRHCYTSPQYLTF